MQIYAACGGGADSSDAYSHIRGFHTQPTPGTHTKQRRQETLDLTPAPLKETKNGWISLAMEVC